MPAMCDSNVATFALPSVRCFKLTATFDGGRPTSNGGVLLHPQAARRRRIAEELAAVISDRRDLRQIVYLLL